MDVLKNTSAIVNGVFPKSEMLVLKSFLKALTNSLESSVKKAEGGAPIVGYHFAFPIELFLSYNIVPVCFEATSYLLAALLPQGSEHYYDIAENFGHPFHSCTSQKGVIGMTLDGLFDFDAITSPTAPCDNTIASYPAIKRIYEKKTNKEVPFIIGDMPNIPRSERSAKYFGKELVSMNEQLGKAIGQEPDYEKLKSIINYNNQSLGYISEINELKKAVPCPTESILCPAMTGSIPLLFGAEKENFFKEVLRITSERYKKKQRASGEEKVRALWPYMSVFFDISLCEWLDREVGMSVLFDLFSYLFFDPIDTTQSIDQIIEGLAKQALSYPMTYQSQSFADAMIESSVFLAREYKADCAIFTNHLGCKQGVSLTQLVREALREELNIPMLTLDIDVGDKRFTSVQTVKKEISNFVNTLNLKK